MPARFRRAGKQLPTEWGADELNRMFASARTMEGDVAGIPARLWWPALLAVILDTGAAPPDVLAAGKADYDRTRGTLTLGLLVYRLHPLTIEALDLIVRHDHDRLLPWPWDNGRSPFYILLRRMKHLLFRVDLPYNRTNMFERLRVTARRNSDVMAELDLSAEVRFRKGKPRLPRARDRRRWNNNGLKRTEAERSPAGNGVQGADPSPKTAPPALYRLQAARPTDTLAEFLEHRYIPVKLAGASASSLYQHRRTVAKFGWYLGCEPTFAQLTDDHVEGFLAWLKAAGTRRNVTCNGYIVVLLAQWRFAWKKRKVDELPRDVTLLKVPKHLPRAWTLEELSRILQAAAETGGDVCGIPAKLWWPAQILTFYYSGLRLDALMRLQSTDLDSQTGILSVPAELQKQYTEQVFKLPPDVVDAVLALGPLDAREWLFPWPYDDDGHYETLRKHYRRIISRTDLPTGRCDLFHKLRRTSASHLAAATDKKTAQEHLGHSHPSVTDRYLDPRITRRVHASDVMERPQWRVVQDDDAA
ncbi:MAG: site-specific integrase [Planctomycetaceae bacterium]|nr:site-specific integrase [Planctomycetaceae bacterium]